MYFINNMISTEFLLYLVSIIFFVFIIFHYYKDSTVLREVKQNQESQQQYPQREIQQQSQMVPPPILGKRPVDPLRQFDYDVLEDEFTPPFRRSMYDDDYSYRFVDGLYPTYTRGPMGRFRIIGTLDAQGVATKDDYKFLNLYGRQKYNGREFEYYASPIDSDKNIKFYIDTRGKEIFDSDTVLIDKLQGYTFIFKEYEDLSPKYDPYFT